MLVEPALIFDNLRVPSSVTQKGVYGNVSEELSVLTLLLASRVLLG